MLDQNATTLLAALIGDLLSAIGGFLANYYIQTSSAKSLKNAKISSIIESIYENSYQMDLILYKAIIENRKLSKRRINTNKHV